MKEIGGDRLLKLWEEAERRGRAQRRIPQRVFYELLFDETIQELKKVMTERDEARMTAAMLANASMSKQIPIKKYVDLGLGYIKDLSEGWNEPTIERERDE